MQERVAGIPAQDEPCASGLPNVGIDRALCFVSNHAQGRDLSGVSETSKQFQSVHRPIRQALKLPDHEIHHIVGEALGLNARQVPVPCLPAAVERDEPFLGQYRDELDDEEGITSGFVLHQLREGLSVLALAAQRIGDQALDIVERQRCERDLGDAGWRSSDLIEGPHERVKRTHFVVAISADQQQVLYFRMSNEMLEKIECRRIQPLQIVEKQRKRVFPACEHGDESPEHHLEALLRLQRGQVRNRRLLADDELELRDEIDDECAVRAQRLLKAVLPSGELGLALSQDRADEVLKGLRQGGIWNVALVLVELAGCEQATRWDEHLMQLVHHGGLANAGIPGHQHQLRGALVHYTVVGRHQDSDFLLSAV